MCSNRNLYPDGDMMGRLEGGRTPGFTIPALGQKQGREGVPSLTQELSVFNVSRPKKTPSSLAHTEIYPLAGWVLCCVWYHNPSGSWLGSRPHVQTQARVCECCMLISICVCLHAHVWDSHILVYVFVCAHVYDANIPRCASVCTCT